MATFTGAKILARLVEKLLTAQRVKDYFQNEVSGAVERYPMPGVCGWCHQLPEQIVSKKWLATTPI